MGGQVSTHGDMYSFGILLLEMFSGKRPTNELFGGNFTLHSYIESVLPGRMLDVADEVVLHNGLRIGFPVPDCLKLVFEVGLRCCEEYPVNRLAMGEALKELITIRERFFRSRRRARHWSVSAFLCKLEDVFSIYMLSSSYYAWVFWTYCMLYVDKGLMLWYQLSFEISWAFRIELCLKLKYLDVWDWDCVCLRWSGCYVVLQCEVCGDKLLRSTLS